MLIRFKQNAQWRGRSFYKGQTLELEDATAAAYIRAGQAEVAPDEDELDDDELDDDEPKQRAKSTARKPKAPKPKPTIPNTNPDKEGKE